MSKQVVKEGHLYFRRDAKDKWEKVWGNVVLMGQLHALKLHPDKNSEDTIASFTISKELVVVGPIPEKDRMVFHLANGRKDMSLSSEKKECNEWITALKEIAESKKPKEEEKSIDSTSGDQPAALSDSAERKPSMSGSPIQKKTKSVATKKNRSYSLNSGIKLKRKKTVKDVTQMDEEDHLEAAKKARDVKTKFKGISMQQVRAKQLQEDAKKLLEGVMNNDLRQAVEKFKAENIPTWTKEIVHKEVKVDDLKKFDDEEEDVRKKNFAKLLAEQVLARKAKSPVKADSAGKDEEEQKEAGRDVPRAKELRRRDSKTKKEDSKDSKDKSTPRGSKKSSKPKEVTPSEAAGEEKLPEEKPSTEKPAEENMAVDEGESPEQTLKREQRRKLIVNEVFTTEKSYVESLEFLIRNIFDPLLEKSEEFNEPKEKFESLFGNVKTIYGFNKKFFEEITKINSDWNSNSLIAPQFKKFVPFLKMYTAYSNNYTQSVEIHKALQNNNEKFRIFIDNIVANSPSKLDLGAYLIMPIQRIPRYSLLLTDLMKNTSKKHPDYKSISELCEQISSVGNHINEEVRRYENAQRVEEMERKGIDIAVFIQPTRFLVKDGLLKVQVEPMLSIFKDTKPSSSESRHFMLFNDILVQVPKELIKHEHNLNNPKYVCPLNLCWVDSSSEKITLTTPLEKITFIDKEKWTEAFYKSITEQVERKQIEKKQKDMEEEEEAKKMNKPIKRLIDSANIVTRISRTGSDYGVLGSARGESPLFDMVASGTRYGEFTYPDECGYYEGHWCNGIRQGQGRFIFKAGAYTGGWRSNLYEGEGKLQYLTGEVYRGQFIAGKQHGRGVLDFADGSRYVGEWTSGSRSGTGTVHYKTGDILHGNFHHDTLIEGELVCKSGLNYTGCWSRNLFDGVGRLTYTDGIVYEGNFTGGLREGSGTLTLSHGAVYKGYFQNNMQNGLGIYTEKDGTVFLGYFKNGLKSGFGRLEKKGKRGLTVYEGEWLNDKKQGVGKSTYPDGSYYQGQWQNSDPHGEGEHRSSAGVVFKGSFVYGQPDGRGEYIYPNGALYEGQVSNGMFHKYGYFQGGEGDNILSYEGDWNMGILSGKGDLTFITGDQYRGTFLNNTFHGEGVYTTADGTTLEGKWEYGTLTGKASLTSERIPTIQGNVGMFDLVSREGGWAVHIPHQIPILPVVPNIKAIPGERQPQQQ